MSYFRRVRAVAGLSGVQSLPRHARVASSALGGGPGPRWYSAMQGVFGDDEAAATASSLTVPTIDDGQGTRQFQADLLEATRGIREHEAERIRKEELRGWVQIAATLSIPLAAALWRLILKRKGE